MKIGLYFGSFNPVHVAHLIIANHVLNETDIEKVWLVVSPQNPFKQENSLLNEYHRLHLVRTATEEDNRIKASDIEFALPKPSYTVNTLTYLAEKHPEHQFAIIMGSDSFQKLYKWKNYEEILRKYKIFVYPRPGITETPFDKHPAVNFVNAPLMDISSTFIRKAIKEKKDVRFYLHQNVWQCIQESGFYNK